MTFLIRPARPEDAPALARVNLEGWRETYSGILSPELIATFSEEQLLEKWERGLESDLAGTVVADVDGEVRGYAAAGIPFMREKPRDLQLYMIYQLASQHGSGSGKALLEAAIGDRPAFVWVARDNPRAIAFYRRNGFETDGAEGTFEAWENLAEIRMVR
jgi:ribosomal protein S18 acetylase RimI-like enzyme